MLNPSWTKVELEQLRSQWTHVFSTSEQDSLRSGRWNELEQLRQKCLIQLEEISGVFLWRKVPLLADLEQQKAAYVAFGEWLGKPVSQDRQGSKVVDIRKTDVSLEDAVSYNAKAGGQLSRPYETDVAFSCHTDPCDVAGLLCLDAASSGGETQLVNSLLVWQRLQASSPELAAALTEPFPYARPGKESAWHAIPIISWQDGYFKCHVVPELITLSQARPGIPPLTSSQKEALQTFATLCRSPDLTLELRLEPGDLLFVNNHVVLHGRSQYQDATDHTRHLLRLWLAVPNSRPLHPIHRAWFGSSEPGVKRGGYG